MLSSAVYALLSTTTWRDPLDVGEFSIVTDTYITDTEYKTHKQMWQTREYLRDNFNNVQTELKMIFKCTINQAYY